MADKEPIKTPFGAMSRSVGTGGSGTLMQLPGEHYPNPEPACALCPAASWYVTRKSLRCWCAERSYVSWLSDDDPVLVCDDCERLVMEEDASTHGAGPTSMAGHG
jgi:hypothetical protein